MLRRVQITLNFSVFSLIAIRTLHELPLKLHTNSKDLPVQAAWKLPSLSGSPTPTVPIRTTCDLMGESGYMEALRGCSTEVGSKCIVKLGEGN